MSGIAKKSGKQGTQAGSKKEQGIRTQDNSRVLQALRGIAFSSIIGEKITIPEVKKAMEENCNDFEFQECEDPQREAIQFTEFLETKNIFFFLNPESGGAMLGEITSAQEVRGIRIYELERGVSSFKADAVNVVSQEPQGIMKRIAIMEYDPAALGLICQQNGSGASSDVKLDLEQALEIAFEKDIGIYKNLVKTGQEQLLLKTAVIPSQKALQTLEAPFELVALIRMALLAVQKARQDTISGTLEEAREALWRHGKQNTICHEVHHVLETEKMFTDQRFRNLAMHYQFNPVEKEAMAVLAEIAFGPNPYLRLFQALNNYLIQSFENVGESITALNMRDPTLQAFNVVATLFLEEAREVILNGTEQYLRNEAIRILDAFYSGMVGIPEYGQAMKTGEIAREYAEKQKLSGNV